MNQNAKLNLVKRLAAIFVRSAVFTAVRLFLMSWYVYFAFFFFTKIEGRDPFYWVVLLLSIFGLWQLIELFGRVAGLAYKERSE